MSTSLEDVFLYALTGVALASGIFCIYCGAVFYIHMDKDAFRKRGVSLQWTFLISSFLATGILNPIIWILAGAGTIDTNGVTRIRLSFFVILVEDLSALVLMCRVFLRYIYVRRNEKSMSWKQVLDMNYSHWILRNYYIVGNPVRILLIAFVFWSLHVLFGLWAYYGQNDLESVQNGAAMWLLGIMVSCMSVFIVMLYSVYQTKGFVDSWHISKEFKRIGWYHTVPAALVVAILQVLSLRELISAGMNFMATSLVAILWYDALWYDSTLWVLKMTRTKQDNGKTKISSNNMVDYLNSPTGFEELMQCCEKAFSSETLLFVVVVVQWRDELFKLGLINNQHLFAPDLLVKLPKTVPKASYVKVTNKSLERTAHEVESIASRERDAVGSISIGARVLTPRSLVTGSNRSLESGNDALESAEVSEAAIASHGVRSESIGSKAKKKVGSLLNFKRMGSVSKSTPPVPPTTDPEPEQVQSREDTVQATTDDTEMKDVTEPSSPKTKMIEIVDGFGGEAVIASNGRNRSATSPVSVSVATPVLADSPTKDSQSTSRPTSARRRGTSTHARREKIVVLKKNMMVFEAIYLKFIERGVAPMEVNISHKLREKMKAYYLNIQALQKIDEVLDAENLLRLWNDVVLVVNDVYHDLYHTFKLSLMV